MEISFYKGKKENLPKIAPKNSIYVTEDTYQMYLSDENNVLHEIDLVDDGETVPTYWTEYWREKTMASGTWYSKVSSVEFFSELCSLQVGLTYDFVGTIYCSDNIYRQTKSISTSLENDVYEVYCTLSDDTKYVIIHSEGSGTTINKIYQISLENDITIHGELYSVLTDCFENETGSIPSGTYYVSSIPSGETELFTMFTSNSSTFYEVKHVNNTIVYRGTDTVTAYNDGWTNESYRWLTFTGASCGGKTNVNHWLSCLERGYKVTFDENGATGTMTDEMVVSGGSYVLPQFTLTAPSGFIFDHYEINGQHYAPGASFIVSGNTTVKCVYSASEVYVTYDGNSLFTLDLSTYDTWEDWADTSINGYAVFRDDEYEVKPYMAEYYIVDTNTGNYVSSADTIISGRQYRLVETEEYSDTVYSLLCSAGTTYKLVNNTNPYGITAHTTLYATPDGGPTGGTLTTATVNGGIADELSIISGNNAELQTFSAHYNGSLVFTTSSDDEVIVAFPSDTYASNLFIKAFEGIFQEVTAIQAGNYQLLSANNDNTLSNWTEQQLVGAVYGYLGSPDNGGSTTFSAIAFNHLANDGDNLYLKDSTDFNVASYYQMAGGVTEKCYASISIDTTTEVPSTFKEWWDKNTTKISDYKLYALPVGQFEYDSYRSVGYYYNHEGYIYGNDLSEPTGGVVFEDGNITPIVDKIKIETTHESPYAVITFTNFMMYEWIVNEENKDSVIIRVAENTYVTKDVYDAFVQIFVAVYPCEHCGEKFPDPIELSEHISENHTVIDTETYREVLQTRWSTDSGGYIQSGAVTGYTVSWDLDGGSATANITALSGDESYGVSAIKLEHYQGEMSYDQALTITLTDTTGMEHSYSNSMMIEHNITIEFSTTPDYGYLRPPATFWDRFEENFS